MIRISNHAFPDLKEDAILMIVQVIILKAYRMEDHHSITSFLNFTFMSGNILIKYVLYSTLYNLHIIHKNRATVLE